MGRAFVVGELCAAIWDAFPHVEGHCLIVPIRHEPNFFALTHAERVDALAILDRARSFLSQQMGAVAWTIQVNAGAPAGQTIDHAHIHLIPWTESGKFR